jgi:hypothetical protein
MNEEADRFFQNAVQLLEGVDKVATTESRVFNVETKDISARGAFIYTKEAAFIPDDTRFILNSSYPTKGGIDLTRLKLLNNCTGTVMRSTSEGIAIRFNEPVELLF